MGYGICLIITLVITWGAQFYLKYQYKKCIKKSCIRGMTGADVARLILEKNGINNVKVIKTAGVLTDHYDPKYKVVRLSPSIFAKSTIASVSVAAHECGHAIQDKNGYLFLRVRRAFVPIVNFASTAGYIAIMVGLFANIFRLIWLGILFEMIILLFQMVTLPVEFNASKRGLRQLEELGIINSEEKTLSRGMLTAAALTYVASVATSIIEILRLVSLARRD